MNTTRIDGALQFPAFLLVLSAGLLIFMGGFYRADAALVSSSPVAFTILQAVPSLTESREFGNDLEAAMRSSEVIAGNWQPSRAETGIEPNFIVALPVNTSSAVMPVTADSGSAAAVVEATEREEATRESPVVKTEPAPIRAVRKTPVQGPASERASMSKRLVTHSVARTDSRIVDLRIEARAALAHGDSVIAYRLLMKNLPPAAEDIDYLALLAVAALDLQRLDEALLLYEKLIKLARTDSRWWMGLAVCQENLGLDASPLYEEVVRLTEEGSPLQGLALDKLDIHPNLS